MSQLARIASMVVVAVVLIAGCSTHNTTLVRREPGDGQVIYRLPEDQAFIIVIDAFAEVLPDQSLYDITGVRRGYWSTWRSGLDTYSQKVLIVPAVGTDPAGRDVRGFWFDVSGSGTAGISGGAKNRQLFRRLQETLDATGTAAIVTNLRDGQYETDGRSYRTEGRDAREAAPRSRRASGGPGTTDKLRELKTMHESGLITDQEYEAKRRHLLDRM